MITPDAHQQRHSHEFLPPRESAGRRTRLVVALTASMMVVEIVAGLLLNSMALLADGWHMSTHALALGIAAAAYAFSARWATDRRFAFGTWKVEILGGFTSGVLLGVIGILVAVESVRRLLHPMVVHYDQAILVAFIGLAVNLASAWILQGAHDAGLDELQGHSHALPHAHRDDFEESHEHDHEEDNHGAAVQSTRAHHHDLNLRAAYLHVLADALTSIFAIVALVGGKFFGWAWLDPVSGIAGSILILRWTWGLVTAAGGILLDREKTTALQGSVRSALESSGNAQVADLHIWQVGPNRFACVAAIASQNPKSPDEYRSLLWGLPELVHVTIETLPAAGNSRAGQ